MKNEKNPFQVRISDNSYIEIVWARAHKMEGEYQPCVADFSADLYVDGIPICTMNKLAILNTTSKTTGESVIHIGSMSTQEKGRKVFSITFFPGSREDKQIEKERSVFVEDCVAAVTAFIEYQNKQLIESRNKKSQHNPQLDKLKEASNTIRTFFAR
jgi:hypothetical protein